MGTPRIRMTIVVMDIFDVVMGAPEDDPAWGLKICEMTGHGTGTVYPALDRMMKAGWIEGRWEQQPQDRPRRRFYEITGAGREAYREAVAVREARRATWLRPELRTGGSA